MNILRKLFKRFKVEEENLNDMKYKCEICGNKKYSFNGIWRHYNEKH